MLRKVAVVIFVLQYALGQDTNLQDIAEKELDGDVKYLDMSSRGLKNTLDLSSFGKLEIANFSNNVIANLEWQRIASAPNLHTLDLSENVDLALPEAGSDVDLNLRVLNMTDCNVQVLGINALNGLVKLEILDLRGNPIVFEKCQVFEKLDTPPKMLIISTITKNELSVLCKHVDMKINIIDDDMVFDCKDIRRDLPELTNISPNREKLMKDVLVDGMIIANTHMELQEMQADEPFEGSGTIDEVQEQTEETNGKQTTEETNGKQTTEKTNGKQITEEAKVEAETPEKVSVFDDDDNPAAEVPEIKKESTFPPPLHEAFIPDSAQEDTQIDMELSRVQPKEFSEVQPKQPLQKSTVVNINVPPANAPSPIHDTDAVLGENKAETSASTGKNVILVLVIGAVIMGSVFGIMKVYKDRKRNADQSQTGQNEGREMKDMSCENKPLMVDSPANGHNPNQSYNKDYKNVPKEDTSCTEVVVDKNLPVGEMSTKEILSNPDGLPDIDDPNRLSTIIISKQNLNDP